MKMDFLKVICVCTALASAIGSVAFADTLTLVNNDNWPLSVAIMPPGGEWQNTTLYANEHQTFPINAKLLSNQGEYYVSAVPMTSDQHAFFSIVGAPNGGDQPIHTRFIEVNAFLGTTMLSYSWTAPSQNLTVYYCATSYYQAHDTCQRID